MLKDKHQMRSRHGRSRLAAPEIMQRVRMELAERRDQPVAGISAQSGASEIAAVAPAPRLVQWKSLTVPDTAQNQFTLTELLAATDETFVDSAYHALLRREPDEDGLAHYLQRLRSGAMTKVEVLAALRWSPEGEAKSVHVDGLLIPYLLQKWRRKALIGPAISWVLSLLRLGQFPMRQQSLDAAAAREAHGLGAVVNQLSLQLQSKFDELEAANLQREQSLESRLHQVHAHVVQHAQTMNETNAALQSGFDELHANVVQQVQEMAERCALLQSKFDRMHDEMAQRHQTVAESQAAFQATVGQQLAALRDVEMGAMAGDIGSLRKCVVRLQESESEKIVFERALDPLYVAFEDRFRGSTELVRARAEPYIELVREAGVGDADSPVLDLGCGRGEWLALLREHGLIGRGVESNRLFVELCEGRGLEVIEGDVIEVMRSLPEASIGAVTGMHIAEHLPFEVLVRLLDEARRVLIPGGLLALETPNPENLDVASHYFYMDPTHRNPLPPEGFRWLVEARGFAQARIERWNVARDMGAPPLLAAEIPGADSMNVLLAKLSMAPDYSIIARRGPK